MGLFKADLARIYTLQVCAGHVTSYKSHTSEEGVNTGLFISDQAHAKKEGVNAGLFTSDLARVYTEGVYAGHVTKFHFPRISRSSVISQINRDQA